MHNLHLNEVKELITEKLDQFLQLLSLGTWFKARPDGLKNSRQF